MEQKPVSEFHRIPEILFHNPAQRNSYSSGEYLSEYNGQEILVTAEWRINFSTKVDGKINLNNFSKNPTARNEEINRAFGQAAEGKAIAVKIKNYTGMNCTALLIRKDLV